MTTTPKPSITRLLVTKTMHPHTVQGLDGTKQYVRFGAPGNEWPDYNPHLCRVERGAPDEYTITAHLQGGRTIVLRGLTRPPEITQKDIDGGWPIAALEAWPHTVESIETYITA